MMKIAIGSDHAGYEYKQHIGAALEEDTIELIDFGTFGPDSVDYPDFAHPVASSVEKEAVKFGILVCGSANGVAMAANKHAGVRAAICWREDLAELARKHNNANIVCIPARFISAPLAVSIVRKFIAAEFEGGRHAHRVDKISC